MKYLVPILLLLLVITNPSVNALREHIGKKSKNDDVTRTYNFFLFSFYEDTFETFRITDRNTYFGFLGNFIVVKKTFYRF